MAEESNKKEIVVYSDSMGNVRMVSVNGTQLDVDSASVYMQGGKVGVTLSIIGATIRSETVSAAAGAQAA